MRNPWKQTVWGAVYSAQSLAPPYQEMLGLIRNYIARTIPKGTWLDLGAGSGPITELLLSLGLHVIATDLSPEALVCAKRRVSSDPNATYVVQDVSEPLPFADDSFDGVTAGLVIQYAESGTDNKWTLDGYKRALREVYRVLKPGGYFVWSVNVPDPDFRKIFLLSWRQIFLTWKMPLILSAGIALVKQSSWLKECARNGRFHYLPIAEVCQLTCEAGFADIEHQITYADQAWVVSCKKQGPSGC